MGNIRPWIPPLVTEKMAVSTALIPRVRGRPPLLAAGISSLIHSHSSSVRSLGYIFSFIYPFYTTCEDFSDRLSGREVPPAGGNTEFASMRAAYTGLPVEKQRQLDALVA